MWPTCSRIMTTSTAKMAKLPFSSHRVILHRSNRLATGSSPMARVSANLLYIVIYGTQLACHLVIVLVWYRSMYRVPYLLLFVVLESQLDRVSGSYTNSDSLESSVFHNTFSPQEVITWFTNYHLLPRSYCREVNYQVLIMVSSLIARGWIC